MRKSKARHREPSRKKTEPNLRISVYMPSKPRRKWGEMSPGILMAEGWVRMG